MLDATEVLASLGAEVEEVSLPLAPLAGVASRTISWVERAGLRPEWLRERAQDLHLNTRVALLTGALIPAQTYYKAQKLRAMVRRQTLEALDRYNILAMPTGPEPAPVIDLRPGLGSKDQASEALRRGSYGGLVSMVGGPAISVCCGFTSEGDGKLPLAILLAGRPFDEATVLKIAHAYQHSTSWHLSRPPV